MAPLTDISRAFGQQQSAEPISRTMQYRKITKPLLERQRRARINRCLDELKDILVSGLQNEGENVARLEKADILELTVRYLHKLTAEQQQQQKSRPSALGEDEKFRVGYATCVKEISKVMASTKIDRHIGYSLMTHLGHALNQMTGSSPASPSPAHHHQQPQYTAQSSFSPISSASSPSRPSSACSADYRPYTPPASPQSQSSEVSSSAKAALFSMDKNVWRPW